jgi:ATP-binding cassette subfamily F protein uup
VVVSAGGGAWVEYAGGYSDMIAQRGYGLDGQPVAAPSAKADGAIIRGTDRPPARRKLGFNEKRALEMLPRRMDVLRNELDGLEKKLADADLAVRQPAAFQAAMARYREVRGALEKAEDEWLALEFLREELES